MILAMLFKNASIVYFYFILIDKIVGSLVYSRKTFSFLRSFVNGNLNFQQTIIVCLKSGFCRVASMS